MCLHRVEWQILLGHTFFTGDVGVVTWLVGLVGDDVLILVGTGVVLLLTDAEGLLLSGEKKRKGLRIVYIKKEQQMKMMKQTQKRM